MRTHMRYHAFAAMAAAVVFVTSASAQTFFANLSGPNEFPPNASPGTGFAQVDFDLATHTLHVQATFSGLTGTTTAAHIHAPTAVPLTGPAGVATQTPTFSGFPLGVTSGTFDQTLDTSLASAWNPAFVTANGGTPAGAEAAFNTSLQNGTAYFNIHTSTFSGGEIRGFLVIPEPTTVCLVIAGGALVVLLGRQSRRS